MRGLSDGQYNAAGERYPRMALCACPTCGQKMDTSTASLGQLREVQLGSRERSILNMLVDAYPKKVTTVQIQHAIGQSNPAPTITNLRVKIERYGWRIPWAKSGPGSLGYQLKKMASKYTRTMT